jgi:hypothetical protein
MKSDFIRVVLNIKYKDLHNLMGAGQASIKVIQLVSSGGGVQTQPVCNLLTTFDVRWKEEIDMCTRLQALCRSESWSGRQESL